VVPSCVLGKCFSHNYKADVCVRKSQNISATMKIELLSSAGYRLRGFDAEIAVPITGTSGVALPARWANSGNIASTPAVQELPKAGEVMLRAHITGGAKLYAINLVGCVGSSR
jgi:hypothetical protein